MRKLMLAPSGSACLRWRSQGFSAGQFARIEGIAVGEVELHLDLAINVLESRSIAEAIRNLNS